jgi:hypothetical protein
LSSFQVSVLAPLAGANDMLSRSDRPIRKEVPARRPSALAHKQNVSVGKIGTPRATPGLHQDMPRKCLNVKEKTDWHGCCIETGTAASRAQAFSIVIPTGDLSNETFT